MVSCNPEKLTQLAEEIVEALGYQLFINDDEPENDPERKKYRQLVQLIEMELSAELFVSTGNSDEADQPEPLRQQTTPVTSQQSLAQKAAAWPPQAATEKETPSEAQSQTRPAPDKPGSTQIRLIHHQDEKTSTGAAILKSLSFSSAPAFGIAIATIFLAGFLTAQYLFGDKNSVFLYPNGYDSGKKTATGQKDSKQQRAAKAFFMMAKSELEKKNYQAAREGFRMALSLEPDNPQYQEAFKQIETLTKGSKKKTRP